MANTALLTLLAQQQQHALLIDSGKVIHEPELQLLVKSTTEAERVTPAVATASTAEKSSFLRSSSSSLPPNCYPLREMHAMEVYGMYHAIALVESNTTFTAEP